jgi:hypothetical protein
LAKAEHLFIKLGCLLQIVDFDGDVNDTRHEIAPEPTGHGLPLTKCEAYNRVYEQSYGSS